MPKRRRRKSAAKKSASKVKTHHVHLIIKGRDVKISKRG